MTLEQTVLAALAMFGPLNAQEIIKKLSLRSIYAEERELKPILANLVSSKRIRKSVTVQGEEVFVLNGVVQ